jgi:hypothetical protein
VRDSRYRRGTDEGYTQLQQTHTVAAAGVVPKLISREIYCYLLSDRSILGVDLAATDAQVLTLTLIGLHVPARLFRADKNAQREVVSAALRSLNCVLAEPTEDVIMRNGDGDLCLETRTSLKSRGRSRAARRQHLPPVPALAVGPETVRSRLPGSWDGTRAGAGLRSGRTAWGEV